MHANDSSDSQQKIVREQKEDVYGHHKPNVNKEKPKYRITSTGAITQIDED